MGNQESFCHLAGSMFQGLKRSEGIVEKISLRNKKICKIAKWNGLFVEPVSGPRDNE